MRWCDAYGPFWKLKITIAAIGQVVHMVVRLAALLRLVLQ
jgi:hypothetical protein